MVFLGLYSPFWRPKKSSTIFREKPCASVRMERNVLSALHIPCEVRLWGSVFPCRTNAGRQQEWNYACVQTTATSLNRTIAALPEVTGHQISLQSQHVDHFCKTYQKEQSPSHITLRSNWNAPRSKKEQISDPSDGLRGGSSDLTGSWASSQRQGTKGARPVAQQTKRRALLSASEDEENQQQLATKMNRITEMQQLTKPFA